VSWETDGRTHAFGCLNLWDWPYIVDLVLASLEYFLETSNFEILTCDVCKVGYKVVTPGRRNIGKVSLFLKQFSLLCIYSTIIL
jgi:hypothetical protein